MVDLVRHRLIPTVYTHDFADRLARTAVTSDLGRVAVHVNVDTGMQRVGVAPDGAAGLVQAVRDHVLALQLGGIYTHLACADEPSSPASADQLDRFDTVLARLAADGVRPALVHVANSAAALAMPSTRRSLVRAGIALYGISPGPGVDHLTTGLRPVMALRARVSHVKRVAAGSAISYGWRHRSTTPPRL